MTVTANLLTGLGIDEFFTRTDGVGVRSLLPDALGSTVALGDGTGTLQTQYTYEPFGFVSQTGAASTNSYKYTGREDDGTGLMYYRARYYHPRLQRFISEDPIESKKEINLYGYVKNNPLSMTDPTGLFACRNCAQAKPLPANSPECDKYGDKLYKGAGLKCFCKCAGNGSWPEQVRGCLACERDNGTDMGEAHDRCYALSGGAFNGPIYALRRCYLGCLAKTDY